VAAEWWQGSRLCSLFFSAAFSECARCIFFYIKGPIQDKIQDYKTQTVTVQRCARVSTKCKYVHLSMYAPLKSLIAQVLVSQFPSCTDLSPVHKWLVYQFVSMEVPF